MESVLVGLIGRGLLGKAVGDTYDLLKATYDGHQGSSRVRGVFEDLDLFCNMETVGSLIGSLSVHGTANSETIEMVVVQIKDSIDAIQDDLQAIGRETKAHKRRWMAGWRSPAYDGPLKRLRVHHAQLNTRVDMLLKLLPVLESTATTTRRPGSGAAEPIVVLAESQASVRK